MENQILGQGLSAARDAFLANRDWIEQCRAYLEASLNKAVRERGQEAVLTDLRSYSDRLKANDTPDPTRRAAIDKDIYALTSFIATMQ